MIVLHCRQIREGDEVECGVSGNRILQRMKLDSKVALITGISLPACLLTHSDMSAHHCLTQQHM